MEKNCCLSTNILKKSFLTGIKRNDRGCFGKTSSKADALEVGTYLFRPGFDLLTYRDRSPLLGAYSSRTSTNDLSAYSSVVSIKEQLPYLAFAVAFSQIGLCLDVHYFMRKSIFGSHENYTRLKTD